MSNRLIINKAACRRRPPFIIIPKKLLIFGRESDISQSLPATSLKFFQLMHIFLSYFYTIYTLPQKFSHLMKVYRSFLRTVQVSAKLILHVPDPVVP